MKKRIAIYARVSTDKHTKMLDFHIYNNVYSIMVDFKNFNKPKYIVIE